MWGLWEPFFPSDQLLLEGRSRDVGGSIRRTVHVPGNGAYGKDRNGKRKRKRKTETETENGNGKRKRKIGNEMEALARGLV